MIGHFSPSLAFARQLQGGCQQTCQWAGGNDELGEKVAGVLWLATGEASRVWIGEKLEWLKAYMVEVLTAPMGDWAHTLGAAGSTQTKAWDNAASGED